MLDIAIRLEDLAPERLTCLARQLRKKYADRNVVAYIFSSKNAARGYAPGSIDLSPTQVEHQAKLHGGYFFNKDKREEYLLIAPDGLGRKGGSAITTRIDLPVTVRPVCMLAVNGRCLLELQRITYPPAIEGGTEVSGRVTLAGKIQRGGGFSQLAIVDARISPRELQSVLIDAAMQNLGTWRFEPGKHEDAVRITYDFEGTDSPLVGIGTGAPFRLPYQVRTETGRKR